LEPLSVNQALEDNCNGGRVKQLQEESSL
jgi:hypothetical protein